MVEQLKGKNKQRILLEEGTKEGIFGTIKDREIERVERERWMGGPRSPEKISFKDGGCVIFKCDIRHYWSPENPDTAIREALVYQIDKIIGLGLVPKTMVINDVIDNVRYDGSVQEWIDNAKTGYEIDKFSEEQKRDFQRLRVFDFIIGNSDRHLENVLFTEDGKLHAIDNNACLVIDKDEDILSFPSAVIDFFSRHIIQDMPHIVDLLEKFYHKRKEILELLDKYLHDNTKKAKLMVESRILFLYKMLKKNRAFPRKYKEWREYLKEEIQNIQKREGE